MTDKEYQDLIRNLELYADIEESSLHRRAADAIEELEAELERVKRELQKSEHDNVNLTGELAKVAAELGREREELKRHLICHGIDYALTDGLWKA